MTENTPEFAPELVDSTLALNIGHQIKGMIDLIVQKTADVGNAANDAIDSGILVLDAEKVINYATNMVHGMRIMREALTMLENNGCKVALEYAETASKEEQISLCEYAIDNSEDWKHLTLIMGEGPDAFMERMDREEQTASKNALDGLVEYLNAQTD